MSKTKTRKIILGREDKNNITVIMIIGSTEGVEYQKKSNARSLQGVWFRFFLNSILDVEIVKCVVFPLSITLSSTSRVELNT